MIAVTAEIQRAKEEGSSGGGRVVVRPSELFDHLVYLSEVCDVLCIAMAELPMLLSPPDIAEALLSIDFHMLETEVRKEQQARAAGGAGAEGTLVGALALGPALEFERSDAGRRLRLVLAEVS